MQITARFLALLVFATAATSVSAADFSLAHARRAQALLGPGVWSQIIRIENDTRHGRYPQEFSALVFELVGRLWFYTDTDGTQSFSLHAGRLAEEKADFAPLLHDIDPGLNHWTVVDDAAPAKQPKKSGVPNGCFIESVAALRARIAAGAPLSSPCLLSWYVDLPEGRAGHTVLVYEEGQRIHVLDPLYPASARTLDTGSLDPLALAQAMNSGPVAKAVTLPLELPAARPPLLATGGDRSEEDAAFPRRILTVR